MNMKKVTGLLILGLFVILSAMAVSAISLTVSAPSSNTYHNSNVTVTATVTGVYNFSNYTISIKDSSSTEVLYIINATANNLSASFSEIWNVSEGGYTDGNYTINVTAQNATNASEWTSSTLTGIVLDLAAPTGNIQFTDNLLNNLTSSLEADYGTDVLVNCTPTDATSTIDKVQSYIAIKYPGLSSYTDNLTLTANTTTQVTATILGSQTGGDLGEFSVKCFVQDNAGNSLTKILNFSTKTVVVGAGSLAGGTGTAAIAGWENPVGTIKIGSGTVSDGGRLTTEGESRLMKDNSVIKFDISGENHRIEVKAATSDKVVLTISSEPFDVTINAGETEEVDVNEDGIADLEVTYHKLFANAYADLTFKQISVPVEQEATDDESVDETTITEEDTEDYASSNGGLTVTLAVIVIILIIGYALIKGKKK